MPPTYWFIRMKHGSDGENFARDLWDSGHIGILFGRWRVADLRSEGNQLDASRVGSLEPFGGALPPERLVAAKRARETILRFVFQAIEGDRVVCVIGSDVCIAEISGPASDYKTEFSLDHWGAEWKGQTESVKVRPISKAKRFALSGLPSVFRVVQLTGRGTFQRIEKSAHLAEFLDRHRTTEEVQGSMAALPDDRFLEFLSPESWEALCSEYLRANYGFRALGLLPGKTLPGMDLVGVGRSGHRILAQCKNDQSTRTAASVNAWMEENPIGPDDQYVFFARGGVAGDLEASKCRVITGSDVLAWLHSDPDYFRALKTL